MEDDLTHVTLFGHLRPNRCYIVRFTSDEQMKAIIVVPLFGLRSDMYDVRLTETEHLNTVFICSVVPDRTGKNFFKYVCLSFSSVACIDIAGPPRVHPAASVRRHRRGESFSTMMPKTEDNP